MAFFFLPSSNHPRISACEVPILLILQQKNGQLRISSRYNTSTKLELNRIIEIDLLRCLDCKQSARARNHMPPFDGILHRNELRSDRKEVETKKCGKTKDRNHHENLNNRLHGIPLQLEVTTPRLLARSLYRCHIRKLMHPKSTSKSLPFHLACVRIQYPTGLIFIPFGEFNPAKNLRDLGLP